MNWEAFVAHHDGIWYIDKENPRIIEEGTTGILMLPIMQDGYGGSYEKIRNRLVKGLKSNNLNDKIVSTFPFHVPVMTAFENQMSGWANWAAEWIPYIELNYERSKKLFDACQDKCFDQGTRHTTLKIINKWAANKGFCFIRSRR